MQPSLRQLRAVADRILDRPPPGTSRCFAPAFTIASAYRSGSLIIRCASKYAGVTGRIALMIGGPKLMFGTKCPSITSRCRKSAAAEDFVDLRRA